MLSSSGARRRETFLASAGSPLSVLLAVGFAAFYAWALHLRHSHYDTYTFDLGLLSQVTWNNLHGHWFATTIMGVNYLAEHFSPALILLSPIFLLWRDAQALLVVQAIAVAAAGPAIFAAARLRTRDSPTALLLQLAFHVAPATGWVVLDEFHPISLAVPLVAAATAALWAKHYRLAAVTALLALLANEDAAIWIAPFGLLIAVAGRSRGVRWGLGATIVSTVWLFAYFFLIVPAVRPPFAAGVAQHPDVGSFSWCGTSISEVADCLVKDPIATARRAFTPHDREALASILAPTAGLGIFGASFLVSWPRWLVLLLGNDPPGYHSHYVALLLPATYLAASEAIGWLQRRVALVGRPLALLVVAASAAGFVLSSPLPGGRAYSAYARSSPETVAAINQALTLIPRDDNVAVAATSSILPHVALRSRVYFTTVGDRPPPDYQIFDQRDPYPMSSDDLRKYLALVKLDPWYRVIFDRNGIIALKRQLAHPDRIVDQSFGGFLRLVGYSIAPGTGVANISFFWHSESWTPKSYHYFIHLADRTGQSFSQKDGELADGYLPTIQMKVGQDVVDQVAIPAPAQSSWDAYHLDVGWYGLPAGERLMLNNGDDHLVAPLAATGG